MQVWFGDVEAAAGAAGHVSPGTCLQCVVPDISHFYPPGCSWLAQPTQVVARTNIHIRAANDPFVFTITEKDLTRAFSWLKVPTSAFTFKTINYTALVGAFSVTILKNDGSFAALLHMSRVEIMT